MVEVKHDKDGWPITYPDRHSISYGVQLEERMQVLEKAVDSLRRYVEEVSEASAKREEFTKRRVDSLEKTLKFVANIS